MRYQLTVVFSTLLIEHGMENEYETLVTFVLHTLACVTSWQCQQDVGRHKGMGVFSLAQAVNHLSKFTGSNILLEDWMERL